MNLTFIYKSPLILSLLKIVTLKLIMFSLRVLIYSLKLCVIRKLIFYKLELLESYFQLSFSLQSKIKKNITGAFSKSSNSLGFSSILQKFWETICGIIFSKTDCKIFLSFCRSHFINNFDVKNNFSEPWNHQKLNIWRFIYF